MLLRPHPKRLDVIAVGTPVAHSFNRDGEVLERAAMSAPVKDVIVKLPVAQGCTHLSLQMLLELRKGMNLIRTIRDPVFNVNDF